MSGPTPDAVRETLARGNAECKKAANDWGIADIGMRLFYISVDDWRALTAALSDRERWIDRCYESDQRKDAALERVGDLEAECERLTDSHHREMLAVAHDMAELTRECERLRKEVAQLDADGDALEVMRNDLALELNDPAYVRVPREVLGRPYLSRTESGFMMLLREYGKDGA